jgi:hypothetical protein
VASHWYYLIYTSIKLHRNLKERSKIMSIKGKPLFLYRPGQSLRVLGGCGS